MQAEALEEQTTKVQKLQDTIAERQGKSRAELEVQLAQEAGKASGMQVHTPSVAWNPIPYKSPDVNLLSLMCHRASFTSRTFLQVNLMVDDYL